ncbi:hypothetical protein CRG98_013565 [Punica granatum]|uniref:Uncharacterized protein n=1 Tax=Punica granatum TaxID=22663 RepID=A0A2I0KCY4_PUNGR|nr:hypothetical protein CRG98_013565 [Punica granatum]
MQADEEAESRGSVTSSEDKLESVADTTLGQTDKLRSEELRDEDSGHDDEAEAYELGSWICEEGANAQDLGGLHVPSGPITRTKARQIQQAMKSSFAGFFGPRGD